MKNITRIATIGSLLIGLGLWYAFWGNQTTTTVGHKMSDGSMVESNPHMDMGSTMQGMMTGLNGKTGDAFDKEFLAQMIVHHQGAVEMAQAVLKTSKRPELLKLAKDIITAQTKEIGMMQSWQKEWFK
jgi:uncharacterized protein (DUF305 family)